MYVCSYDIVFRKQLFIKAYDTPLLAIPNSIPYTHTCANTSLDLASALMFFLRFLHVQMTKSSEHSSPVPFTTNDLILVHTSAFRISHPNSSLRNLTTDSLDPLQSSRLSILILTTSNFPRLFTTICHQHHIPSPFSSVAPIPLIAS